MSTEKGIEKTGYLEVKQPSTTKGRKLKSWKKRWVVVHQMSDLANGKYNAKIDIYPYEASSKKSPNDKMTFVLENITAVRLSKSKTHPNAFEVVEMEPVLVFSAASEQETATWMSIYRRIFQHDKLGEFDIFGVNTVPNHYSRRMHLEDHVLLSINPTAVRVLTTDYKPIIEWRLSTIKRFYTEEESKESSRRLLIFETGPSSSTGEGQFCFTTPEWELILKTIRKNINLAISERQHNKLTDQLRDRSSSTSTTTSEFHFTTLLANSDEPSGSCSVRSNSMNSLGSSVFTSGSNPDCSATPPLSPVTSSGNKQLSPVTSTPNPCRNTRAATFNIISVNVTGSTLSVVDDGYSVIRTGENDEIKPRSGSVSSTNSTTSNKSHLSRSIARDSGLGDTRNDSIERKSGSSVSRTVSNSFDSGFSNGSYDETTKRKGSDIEKTIAEETNSEIVKSDTSNIYQELDNVRTVATTLVENPTRERRCRRHSTGDVEKESDYAELDCRNREDGIFGSSGLTAPLDIPPALPDRPASLRWSNSMRAKPSWRKRLSALLISGQSPGHSPERCESPVSHQKPTVMASDIVLDNINNNSSSERKMSTGSEHLYQSIPEVLASSEKKFATLPSRFTSSRTEPCNVASDIVLPPHHTIDHIISAINSKTEQLALLDTVTKPPKVISDPLIDFFFKDDGFEIIKTAQPSHHGSQTPPSEIQASLPTPPPVTDQPLIDLNAVETAPTPLSPTTVPENQYIEMTNKQTIPTVVMQRTDSVEYIPPSEIRAAISEGNLIDI